MLLVVMLSSCAPYQTKTGQRFYEGSPSFYLSVAPSFSAPKEYEVVANSLILRTYSGAGGYNWGKRKEKLKKTLTTAALIIPRFHTSLGGSYTTQPSTGLAPRSSTLRTGSIIVLCSFS